MDLLWLFSALSSEYFLICLIVGNLNCLWWGCSVMSREGCVSLTGGGGGGDWDLEAEDGHRPGCRMDAHPRATVPGIEGG